MQIEHLYGGSALATVGRGGRVRLPRFVRETADRRSGAGLLVLGLHERDSCLTAYDPAWRRILFDDSERQRLRDEGAGADAGRHYGRARRAFGLTEQAEIDAGGQIALPPMVRSLARIEGHALFVGTGGAFEIWNPELAAQSGDPTLADIARWRLGEGHDHDPRTSEGED